METGYKIVDIMTNKPITAHKDMTLKDAAVLLSKEDVNSLIIVEDKKPVGIVTDEDIVRKCVAMGLDSKKLTLKDIAFTDLVMITQDKDMMDALKLMREHNIRQLPVIEKNLLVGFVTLKDILKIQPDLMDIWMEQYELLEGSNRLKEIEDIENDDGSEKFFKKLKIKSKLKASSKKKK
ncbi:MAG TPA: CBS domain-containing protein [Alphaproteobacteria bacterium]|nr:CBS domain-containing protein [Alphaproteobacteria bacterium]